MSIGVNPTDEASGSGILSFIKQYLKKITSGDLELGGGNVIISSLGKGLQVKTGTGGRAGTATLVGGTVTVANTSITANTQIMVSRKTAGGTTGNLSTTRVNGVSFTIVSTSGTDTSSVDWFLIEKVA